MKMTTVIASGLPVAIAAVAVLHYGEPLHPYFSLYSRGAMALIFALGMGVLAGYLVGRVVPIIVLAALGVGLFHMEFWTFGGVVHLICAMIMFGGLALTVYHRSVHALRVFPFAWLAILAMHMLLGREPAWLGLALQWVLITNLAYLWVPGQCAKSMP